MARNSSAGGRHSSPPKDEQVGYGSPPRHTQFKLGVSGNPKGRPKWSEEGQFTSILMKEIFRTMKIQQNGTTIAMPVLQVCIRRLLNSGAKGDVPAILASMKSAQLLDQLLASQKMKAPRMTQEERIERIKQLFAIAALRKEKKDAARLAKGSSVGKDGT